MATFMIVAKPIGKQPQKRLRVGLFITTSQSFGYNRYRAMAHREKIRKSVRLRRSMTTLRIFMAMP